MKKEYRSPKAELICFETEDVLTASKIVGQGENEGGYDGSAGNGAGKKPFGN